MELGSGRKPDALIIGRIAFPFGFAMVIGFILLFALIFGLAFGWIMGILWIAIPSTVIAGSLVLWAVYEGIRWTVESFIILNRKEL